MVQPIGCSASPAPAAGPCAPARPGQVARVWLGRPGRGCRVAAARPQPTPPGRPCSNGCRQALRFLGSSSIPVGARSPGHRMPSRSPRAGPVRTTTSASQSSRRPLQRMLCRSPSDYVRPINRSASATSADRRVLSIGRWVMSDRRPLPPEEMDMSNQPPPPGGYPSAATWGYPPPPQTPPPGGSPPPPPQPPPGGLPAGVAATRAAPPDTPLRLRPMRHHHRHRGLRHRHPLTLRAAAPGAEYGGSGLRFVARLIDGLILGIPFGILFIVVAGMAAASVSTTIDPTTGQVSSAAAGVLGGLLVSHRVATRTAGGLGDVLRRLLVARRDDPGSGSSSSMFIDCHNYGRHISDGPGLPAVPGHGQLSGSRAYRGQLWVDLGSAEAGLAFDKIAGTVVTLGG